MQTILLKIPQQHWKQQIRKELAIQLYREGLISYAHARRLAGIKKVEIHHWGNLYSKN